MTVSDDMKRELAETTSLPKIAVALTVYEWHELLRELERAITVAGPGGQPSIYEQDGVDPAYRLYNLIATHLHSGTVDISPDPCA